MSMFEEDDIERDVTISEYYERELADLYSKSLFRMGDVSCIESDESIVVDLKKLTSSDIISVDCRLLRKGDAYGFLQSLSKCKTNPIVVIENVTQIPSGMYCDDPVYVENILARSWKNESIYVGDICLNREDYSVILTAPCVDREKLMHIAGMCSYAYKGEICDFICTTDKIARMRAEAKYKELKEKRI